MDVYLRLDWAVKLELNKLVNLMCLSVFAWQVTDVKKRSPILYIMGDPSKICINVVRFCGSVFSLSL